MLRFWLTREEATYELKTKSTNNDEQSSNLKITFTRIFSKRWRSEQFFRFASVSKQYVRLWADRPILLFKLIVCAEVNFYFNKSKIAAYSDSLRHSVLVNSSNY